VGDPPKEHLMIDSAEYPVPITSSASPLGAVTRGEVRGNYCFQGEQGSATFVDLFGGKHMLERRHTATLALPCP
jgi:hypothetical protein